MELGGSRHNASGQGEIRKTLFLFMDAKLLCQPRVLFISAAYQPQLHDAVRREVITVYNVIKSCIIYIPRYTKLFVLGIQIEWDY